MLDNNGTAWHTIRHANGVWERAQQLPTNSGPSVPTGLVEVAASGG